MNKDNLIFLKQWFSDYCRAFYSANKEDQRNISLKETHTHNVCGNIIAVADGLFSTETDMLLAETIALFHDVGRFPQYMKCKTFNDGISVNHGLLGANILLENKIILNLSQDEQDLIVQAVEFHNAFKLPDIQNNRDILFLKLIRDAD
ncbi:MAG: HD domain-containing protein, partial [Nitrospirae bacterium]|nr:HD domain-containing protein [Nitrospirota bacterium]